MTKITQKQLIESLSQLKEIKPRKEWAVLLKSTLLENKVPSRMTGVAPAQKASFMDILSAVFAPRKLAYSFAVVLFLIVGVFGFASNTMPGDLLFPVKKIAEQSQAALIGQTSLNRDVVALSNRINDLVQVAKEGKVDNIPSAINEVTEIAKDLKNNPTTDSQAIKNIASSLKTLADVPGTDLSENPDVKDLYKTVAYNQINDLESTTLTQEQKNALTDAENLYNQGKYMDALEKVLMINN